MTHQSTWTTVAERKKYFMDILLTMDSFISGDSFIFVSSMILLVSTVLCCEHVAELINQLITWYKVTQWTSLTLSLFQDLAFGFGR